MGFESTSVSDWAIIQSGRGTLSSSTNQSQGLRALTVAARGYVPIQSLALSSLGSRVGNVIHLDIWVPPEVNSISPSYHGAVQLNFSIPSAGVNNNYLGQAELTPLPVGQWSTLSFTPTAQQIAKLSGNYSDLRFTIAINSPATDATPYLNYRVDNLRLSDKTLALVTVLDGSNHAISGVTVVAYKGSSATSYTGVTDSTGLAKIWVPTGSYRFAVTDGGFTYYSSISNHCQVPGLCVAATIVAKCHAVTCAAKDLCHNAGTCDPGTGVCSNPAKPAGTVCRPSVGLCDVAEVCAGTDAGCPADGFLQASLQCRPSAGPCDLAEICSGTSANCPGDGFLVAGTVCRAAAGACDVAESCSGTSAPCPADGKASDGTTCDDGNACTTEDKCQAGSCVGVAVPVVEVQKKSFDINASFDATTGTSVDGEIVFLAPTEFILPAVIPVLNGLAGNGTATLTFHSAATCIDVSCTYRGGSSSSHATSIADMVLGHMYFLQGCSDGTQANAILAVTRIRVSVASGDTGTPLVEVQIVATYPEEAGGPPPPDGGIPDPVIEPVPPQPTDHQTNGISPEPPDLSKLKTNPMVDGEFIPQAVPTR